MEKAQVLIFQHVDWEKPGRILDNLDEMDMPSQVLNIARKKKPDLPDFNEVAGVVIMGGPMGAMDYDRFPGLKAEGKIAKAAIAVGKPVLGICLGHQIIATALGAKLKPGKGPEIGFSPIHRVDRHDYFSMWSKELTVLHWHNDVVSLPQGGQLLAKSALTKNQAFRVGSALGLQFHLEVSAPLFEEWLATPEMVEGMKKADLSRLRDDFAEFNPRLQPLAESVFSGFAARCASYAKSISA